MSHTILRLPAVLKRRGRSRSSHYADINAGLHVKPVQIGSRAVGTPEDEVDALNAARIVGNDRFEGVNKKIGSRELFFVWLLFRSNRTHDFAGERITVVSEEDVSQELIKWRDDGYLKFAGKDQDKPAYRVQKMWGEFVRQIEKEVNLKNLFTNAHKSVDRKRLYAICLRPNEKQIAITSIPALFQKSTA